MLASSGWAVDQVGAAPLKPEWSGQKLVRAAMEGAEEAPSDSGQLFGGALAGGAGRTKGLGGRPSWGKRHSRFGGSFWRLIGKDIGQ